MMRSKLFLKSLAKLLLEQKRLSVLVLVFLLIINVNGCAPSYPKEKLAESLIKICEKTYNINVQVKLIGRNIVVFIPLTELFNSNLDIAPEAVNKIESVILSTSRLLFSTDAKVDFYTIIAADVHATAAEVILVRCMDDVYKFMHGWISREEYRKRILWQVNFNIELIKDAPFNFDIEEMTMPNFLAEQISQRINLKFNSSIVNKAKVSGSYSEEKELFSFSLPVKDNSRFNKIYVPIILNIAEQVLLQYKFTGFNQLEVKNELLRNFVVFDKAELEGYRTINIDELLTLPYYD
ncbi:MAG: hypothetical protein V1747_06795 [Candidatus Omnitrophota bacterium]